MSESENVGFLDDELIAWGKEIDDIMNVAVEKAIAENKRLGLYAGTDQPADPPRVAEED